MRTPKGLYRTSPTIYLCELETCPTCHKPMSKTHYLNGLKTVQTMTAVQTIAYRPKRCFNPDCPGRTITWPAAAWQARAPKYGTYGYDVIAQIGWERQRQRARFAEVQARLDPHLEISEAHVRHLYHCQYLPLLACHERQHLADLQKLAQPAGLLLGMDGLMPEGGEPQLWLVRELQTGWTLRSGWLDRQDEATFAAFLQPIADLGLPIQATLSDKQAALLSALKLVFPQARHGLCQLHYLKNAAQPVADADEQMKIALRQAVRAEIGDPSASLRAGSAAPQNRRKTGGVDGHRPDPLPDATPVTGLSRYRAVRTCPDHGGRNQSRPHSRAGSDCPRPAAPDPLPAHVERSPTVSLGGRGDGGTTPGRRALYRPTAPPRSASRTPLAAGARGLAGRPPHRAR